MAKNKSPAPAPGSRLITPLVDLFGLSRPMAAASVVLITAAILFAVFWFFHSAPPHSLTISAGTEGSSLYASAVKYREILARNGVKLKILPSQGSLENLRRLADSSSRVDIGFVQGGSTNGIDVHKINSLGSISYEPLFIFCRGNTPVTRLSQLAGQRLAIGPHGSGTRALALTLLATNGIQADGTTVLLDLDAGEAAKALVAGTVDAAFLMGDSASSQIMRDLLRAPGIQLLDFTQAEAYVRRFTYLNRLELPEGSIDFGKDIPAKTVNLIGPTVELLARPNLHPALCNLLIDAATEVHGGAGLLKRKGEFPAATAHEFPISPDAEGYYKSGKSFLYRHLPFQLASLVSPFVMAFIPVMVLLIPTLRMIPTILRLRVRLIMYRWYRSLLALERELPGVPNGDQRKELLERLDGIEVAVNRMKVSAPFADQFYGLREHIAFVRLRIRENPPKT